jgi:predicted RNase H-like nuclease (RuvC/YqgF family)
MFLWFICWMRCVFYKIKINTSIVIIFDLTCLSFTKHEAKKNSTPHIQSMPELQLPQAQVLGELVMEPLNKALQEENGRLKCENEVLKERESSKNKEMLLKQELVDEYKARAKNVEEEIQRAKDEIQRGKDEIQRFRDEMTSLKEKEIRLNVEVEYLKRIDEQLRLERNAERVMFQSMMSNLICGIDDRKRKRNEDEETK